jgi:hypothetical protein
MNKKVMLLELAVATFLSGGIALADDQFRGNGGDQYQAQNNERDQYQAQKRQTVGRDMMTTEEHQDHRTKMRSAPTRDERAQVRADQHEKMKQRAEEQGKSLPENPPAGGMMGGEMGGRMGGGGKR